MSRPAPTASCSPAVTSAARAFTSCPAISVTLPSAAMLEPISLPVARSCRFFLLRTSDSPWLSSSVARLISRPACRRTSSLAATCAAVKVRSRPACMLRLPASTRDTPEMYEPQVAPWFSDADVDVSAISRPADSATLSPLISDTRLVRSSRAARLTTAPWISPPAWLTMLAAVMTVASRAPMVPLLLMSPSAASLTSRPAIRVPSPFRSPSRTSR
ncbi:hypothetical protein ACMZ4X_01255 [Achromobacter marplatensis]